MILHNCPHTKYLGVTIQSKLKWDVHCKQVAAKATKTLNVLKWNLKSTKEVCEKAYKSLVCLLRVQHRAAHYVYNTYSRYSSVTAMLQSLDWETLESCRFNVSMHYLQSLLQPGHVSLVRLCYTCHSPNLG